MKTHVGLENQPEASRIQEQMLAGVIVRPLAAETRLAPVPVPEPGEIRVRLAGCGLCGSNLPVWEGKPWFDYPRAPGSPGHEAWGHVDAVGTQVTAFRTGDHVAILSEHGFAEFDMAPQSQALLLPPEFETVPFPAEPLACAMNVFKRSVIQPDQSVAIVGIGFLGALLTQLATYSGARVAAISRRSFARNIAEACGADSTFDLEDSATTLANALEWNNNRYFDCVIEAAGTQATLDLAAQMTREKGRLVIAGYHQDGPRSVDMQLWNWRGIDVINAHERDPQVYLDGMRAAIAAVVGGLLDPAPLYTHTFPLAEMSKAFEMLRLRPDGFLKALVVP